MEWKWNADVFDAIRIAAPNAEFEIVGTNGKEVIIHGDGNSRWMSAEPQLAGRWLLFHPIAGQGEWSLQLPKSKAWVLQISAGSGEVSVEDVHARFEMQLGSGEVQMEHCRGVFNIRSGNGDIKLEDCVQADVPPMPERSEQESFREPGNVGGVPPAPGVPPIPGVPPVPPVPPFGFRGRRRRIRVDNPGDWEDYGRQWDEWGEHLGEQFSRWAEKFSREFVGDLKFGWQDDEAGEDGIRVRLGHGDIKLETIDAQLVTAHLGSGDIQIEDGRIGSLDAETSQGDISVENILPTNAWELTTRHGDIGLNLPTDAYVRLDAATRHGDIQCEAPLVRVARPGPGARHGGRMVGTVGEGQGEAVDIHLESLHGDIEIEMTGRASRYAGQPMPTPSRNVPTPAPAGGMPTVVQNPAPAPSAVVPVRVTDLPPEDPTAALKPPSKSQVQVYDSQLAILQALQRGEITVAEAEMLMRSLKG